MLVCYWPLAISFFRHFTEDNSEALGHRGAVFSVASKHGSEECPKREPCVIEAIYTFICQEIRCRMRGRGGMRPLILLAVITPSARSCFDETRGGCFTAGFVDNLSSADDCQPDDEGYECTS